MPVVRWGSTDIAPTHSLNLDVQRERFTLWIGVQLMPLVLIRKANQRFLVDNDVHIVIGEIRGDRVKLVIDAPRQKQIVRGEHIAALKSGTAVDAPPASDDESKRPVLLSRMLRDGRKAEAYLGSDNNIYLAIEGQRLKTLDLGNIVESVACIA